MSESTKQEFETHPFLASLKELAERLETNLETGLTEAQAKTAADKYGPNKLEDEGGVKWYHVLTKQISNAMILVRILP